MTQRIRHVGPEVKPGMKLVIDGRRIVIVTAVENGTAHAEGYSPRKPAAFHLRDQPSGWYRQFERKGRA